MPLEGGPGLGFKWISELLGKLVEIREERRDAITAATQEVSAADPYWLAGRYIEPNVQETNPADQEEESPYTAARLNQFHAWLSIFLQKPFHTNDGRHVLFLLADAGMGKSSALVMLYLTHVTRFWPQSVKFELFKLNDKTLGKVEQIKHPKEVVLLLDALDEDRSATSDTESRILEILDSTSQFRQVILTCRTQFFPRLFERDYRQRQYEKDGKFEIGGYVCQLLYLSPFDDRKVFDYLEKLYTPGGEDFQKAWSIIESMGNMRIRPLLLSYIEELMETKDLQPGDILGVYEVKLPRFRGQVCSFEQGGPDAEITPRIFSRIQKRDRRARSGWKQSRQACQAV